VQVEVLAPWGRTYSAASTHSRLSYLARPRLASVLPSIAPFLTAGSEIPLVVTGKDFDAALTYTCTFTRPASLQEIWTITATRVDATTLNCLLPAATPLLLQKLADGGPFFLNVTLRAEWPATGAGGQSPSESTSWIGDARVLLYEPPKITGIWPDHGSTAGGTAVYVMGERFHLGLASTATCRFGGASVVIARVISQSRRLLCVAPANAVTAATAVSVAVSVDGVNYFSAPTSPPTFTYTPVPVFDPATDNIAPARVGADNPQDITITATELPAAALLATGLPACRFSFSTTSITKVTYGTLADPPAAAASSSASSTTPAVAAQSTLVCPTPAGPPDALVTVSVSFNGADFHTVLT
jgi:hypothetical protein